MALVSYTSSSEDESDVAAESDRHPKPTTAVQPAKKRKTSHQASEQEKASSDLPPLPSAFHDLYASTVRVSTTDDPTLHQGRKRQIPHVVGNWPTHLYIEWHPTSPSNTLLTTLLNTLSSRLSSRSLSSSPIKLSTFLTSDLGAALPLHISLSRPLALTTAQKDDFLSSLRDSLSKCSVPEFELVPRALEWHRTNESARSFLVLRVGRTGVPDASSGTSDTEGEKPGSGSGPGNTELSTLLHRCNAVARSFDQPELYAFKSSSSSKSKPAQIADVNDAFHVSIAWSFAEPTAELRRLTEEVFSEPKYQDGVRGMRIRVDAVKAKIGNVVTHVGFSNSASRPGQGRGMFGF
ncbi:hypothetical protein BJ170DRAFT_684140 [Xylariales sp. AK1849]|nr:hypothetical protein BJ170DRAFT_684140 [Xylariales sp. AK1849]